MLETKKSTTLTGTITVKDGDVDKQVVYLSANVTSDGAGNDNVNQTIQDRDLYKANKVQIRKIHTTCQFSEVVHVCNNFNLVIDLL